MAEEITSDQLLEAARDLGKDEFSRPDLAEKLGVDKSELRRAFKAAKQSGRIEKTRDDEDNTGYFRLTG